MIIPRRFMSQIDGSLVQIHTKFHDYSMSFIQALFVFHAGTWHGFWTSSSHGISMVIAKKMMGFPSDFVHFRPNGRQNEMRKSVSHFLQGSLKYLNKNSFSILNKNYKYHIHSKFTACTFVYPVKNVTGIFSCLFDGSLVENDTKSDGKSIIFLGNAMKIHDLNLFKIHVMCFHRNQIKLG